MLIASAVRTNASKEAPPFVQYEGRPATSPSPTPNFFTADNYGHHKSTNSRQPQAKAQSRLRPLPPRGTPCKGLMFIEGMKTGEEKVVAPPTQSLQPPIQAAADPAPKKQVVRDDNGQNQRLRKLEAELRRSTELVKKQAREITDLKSSLEASKAETETQRGENGQLLNKYEKEGAQRQAELRDLQSSLTDNKRLLEKADRRNNDLESQLSEALASGGSSNLERDTLQKTCAALEAEVRSLNDREANLRADAASAKRDAEKLRTELDQERLARTQTTKQLTGEIERLTEELRQARETLEQWKSRIERCDDFIVKICQPSFSVVKDDSLAAMPSDNKDGDGFVLVPLKLLLGGYSLLPGDTKKGIASDYEKQRSSTL